MLQLENSGQRIKGFFFFSSISLGQKLVAERGSTVVWFRVFFSL